VRGTTAAPGNQASGQRTKKACGGGNASERLRYPERRVQFGWRLIARLIIPLGCKFSLPSSLIFFLFLFMPKSVESTSLFSSLFSAQNLAALQTANIYSTCLIIFI
jgi:hypothetical protein